MTETKPKTTLLQHLDAGPVICAEGYVFELERRGYLQAGAFVPEVVLEHPEALIALDVIKEAKQVAVITLAMHQADVTRENWSVADACKRIADAGADVVGLNCIRGPATMLPLLQEIRAMVKTHLAALPVPFRTTEREPSFQSLRDAKWNGAPGWRPFPVALDPFTCNRFEIAEFGREAAALDIRYLGVCCGAGPHHIRALADRKSTRL